MGKPETFTANNDYDIRIALAGLKKRSSGEVFVASQGHIDAVVDVSPTSGQVDREFGFASRHNGLSLLDEAKLRHQNGRAAGDIDTASKNYGSEDKITEDNWELFAACQEIDTNVFLPSRGESLSAPRAICRNCLVVDFRKEAALEKHEKFGIWGGLSERERRRIRRQRAQAARSALS